MRQTPKKNKRILIWSVVAAVVFIIALKGPGYIGKVFYDDFYERSDEPVLGLFDHAAPAATRPLKMPHYTVFWKNTSMTMRNRDGLVKKLSASDVLLTIETWLENYSGTQSTANVLDAILNGKFDRNIGQLASLINQSPHVVYVRWAPDMEVPVYQCPWQYQSPGRYIKAFGYIATALKAAAPKVKIIWGPSGFPGDTEFWPGNQYADLAAVTLGSKSETSSQAYPYHAEMPALLFAKLHRMRFIGKPVLVLGGAATAQHQFNASGLKQALELQQQYDTTIYSAQNYSIKNADKPLRQQLKVGVFDPMRRIVNNPNISVEHIFTDWAGIEGGGFKLGLDSILNRHHDVVVTVEPWRDTSKRPDDNVLQSTLNGRYDKTIKKLYTIISNCGQTVYLRFAHEMEIPIHRYAWQSKNPVTYINAYRYFMHAGKPLAPNIKRVWGPAGDRGSADWWPGSDVVDYISIAIYGLPDKNVTDPNKQESFSTIFERKYYRMRFLNRPLFITEFGVKGPEDYQHKWLAGAAQTLKNNRHVFGICYFNLFDNPKAWGHIKAPDWSISPQNMQFFCESVNGKK